MDAPAAQNPGQPPRRSAARTWLRILAWIVPGVSAPALLLGWFVMVYPRPEMELPATIGAIGLLIVIVVGCGFFNAILRPARPTDDPGKRSKQLVVSVLIFCAAQVAATPAIGFTTATACNFITYSTS